MIHPLTKLIIVLCISTISIAYNSVLILGVLLCTCLLLISGKRNLDYYKLWKFLRYFLPLLISIFIIQIVFNQKGKILIDLHLLRITGPGLKIALLVIMRLLVLFLSGVWLWGLGHREFNQAFRAIGLPETLAVMISLTLRFLPVLTDKVKQSASQLKLRGIDLHRTKLRAKMQLYLKMVIPILGWTMKDLKYQAIALDLRGFRNGIIHTQYKQRRLNILDWLLILIALSCLLLPRFLWGN